MMFEKNVDVSVVVVCYNQSDTIERALRSVVEQRVNFSMEIIVADDGSSDDTRAKCCAMAGKYPDVMRVLPPKHNRGLVENYFSAMREVRGRYVTDLAGDDYYVGAERLQRQFDLMESVGEDVVMVHGDWVFDTSAGVERVADRGYVAGRQSGREMMERVLQRRLPLAVQLSTAMFRAKAVKAFMTEDSSMMRREWNMEDMPLICGLFSRGDVWYMPEVWLGYCFDGRETLSTPVSMKKTCETFLYVTTATAEMADFYGVTRERINGGLRRDYEFVMAQAWHLRDRKLAKRVIEEGRRHRLPMTWKVWMARMVMGV